MTDLETDSAPAKEVASEIHVSYEIVPGDDKKVGKLILRTDEAGQASLKAWRDRDRETEDEEALFDGFSETWGTHRAESALLERMIANSELEWGRPETGGDLTDAPILCIWGEEIPNEKRSEVKEHFGFVEVSSETCCPVINRWAFMGYEIRSFMDDLADYGKAVFVDRN